jgi:hypothetical protein
MLAISSGVARAQALAPETLSLPAGGDQKPGSDMVEIAREKPVHAITKKRPVLVAKKSEPVVKEPAPAVKEAAPAIPKDTARALAIEPVRPMNQPTVSQTTKPASHFNFRTAQGKQESVPVISNYYPKQIVYPFAKVDKHIDGRLMQAASIAEERAHAHSRSRCWHYVKEALLASGVIDSRPKSELARDAASDLVNNYGFKKLSVNDPFAAPLGSVLVYGTSRSVGHVEFRTKNGFVSDFRSPTPSRRPLLGVFAKL